MSAPIKKRALQIEGNANEERSSSDDVSEEEDAQEYTGQEVSWTLLNTLKCWYDY